jgi:hydroxymethylbilane synthase
MVDRARLRIATRGSALARWQSENVAGLLEAAAARSGSACEVELVIVETAGDQRVDVPIWEMGGKGVFVKEVQAAVLEGRADLAVHSAKDLPASSHPDLVIAAVPTRADPRDALVGSTLDGLPPGAVVATGSVRRRAQLSDQRPDLTFTGLRGNIGTRLEKIPPGGAIVMAAAAIERLSLDLAEVDHEILDPAVLLPQVGQGALAIECRTGDADVRELLAPIDDPVDHRLVDAERAFLAELGGDCDLPAGAHAVGDGTEVEITGMLASMDGHVVMRHVVRGAADEAGRRCARYLLDESGGNALLHP